MNYKPPSDDFLADESNGFVLPYVLVVIGVLAIVTVIIAERFDKQSRLLSEIVARNNAEIALESAAAASLFALLTSSPTDGGMDLSGKSLGPLGDGLGAARANLSDDLVSDIWSVSQGMRQFPTPLGPVIVTVQDGAGFLPLNTVVPELLERYMVVLGFSEDAAQNKVATLFDYIDPDHLRQFRGGERADYRLRRMTPPTNSPLRHYNELALILGWGDDLTGETLKHIQGATTLSSAIGYIKPVYVESQLKEALALGEPASRRQNLSGALLEEISVDSYPSAVLRLTLIYPIHRGRALKRVMEFERRVSYLDKPFTRQQLYEDVVSGDAVALYYEQMSDLQNVIFATSDNAEE